MKKLRRLCTFPDDTEPKMHTIYEYHGKLGTMGSTILWLDRIPVVGEDVWGICEDTDRVSPYMEGHAFRYAEFSHLLVDRMYSEDGVDFVFCRRF